VVYTLIVFFVPLTTVSAAYKIVTIDKTGVFNITGGVGFYLPTLNWVKDAFRSGASFNAGAGIGVSGNIGLFGNIEYTRLRSTEILDSAYGGGKLRLWSGRGGVRFTAIVAGEKTPFAEVALGVSRLSIFGPVGSVNRYLWYLDMRGGYEFFMDKNMSIDLSAGFIYYLQNPGLGGLNLPVVDGERRAAIIPLRMSFNFYL